MREKRDREESLSPANPRKQRNTQDVWGEEAGSDKWMKNTENGEIVGEKAGTGAENEREETEDESWMDIMNKHIAQEKLAGEDVEVSEQEHRVAEN